MKLIHTIRDVIRSVKELPDAYRPAASEDVPAGRACDNCVFFDEADSWCEKWEDTVSPDFYCDAWEPAQDEQ